MRTIIYYFIASMSVLPFQGMAQTTVTDADGSVIKGEFNSLKNYHRVVTVVDPLCSACRAHANDLRNVVFNQCNNPDLRAIIIWVKTPGFLSTKSDAINQASLWSDTRVKHFWNTPVDDIPMILAAAAWTGCTYAWDISLFYAPGAEWTATHPPAPEYCMAKVAGCCNSYSIGSFKMAIDNAAACTGLGIPEKTVVNDLVLFPNPARSELHINSGLFHGEGSARVEIRSLSGQVVVNTLVYLDENHEFAKLNLPVLDAGMYLFSIQATGKLPEHRKLLIR
jgi:hypothetical protein